MRRAWLATILITISGCHGRSARPQAAPDPIAIRRAARTAADHEGLAARLLQTGDTWGAIEEIEAARQLGDQQEGLLEQLSDLYARLGELEEAAQVLEPAGGGAGRRIALAERQLDLGWFQRAADAVRPLESQAASLPPEAQKAAARILLLNDEPASASRFLPAHASATMSDPYWLSLSGLMHLEAKRPKEAIADLQTCLRVTPDDGWDAYLLGQAELLDGNRSGALSAWRRSASSRSAPVQAEVGAATLLAAEGDAKGAGPFLDAIPVPERRSPGYWRVVALIARQGRQPGLAAMADGYRAYNAGDPWAAEKLWTRAATLLHGDDRRQAYLALVNSAERRHDADTALQQAASAAALWPRDPQILDSLAELLLKQGLLSRALKVANELMEVAPPAQQVETDDLLCRIALDSGRPALLQRSAAQEKALAPKDARPYLHLAEWQSSLGTPAGLQAALKLYTQAEVVAPDAPEPPARAGMMLQQLDRPAEAARMLLHALSLVPRVLEGAPSGLLAQIYQRANLPLEAAFETQTYVRLRRMKDGWPTLLKAMRIGPADRTLSDWLPLARMALDRHETWVALCAAQRAISISPRNLEAWQMLAAARKRDGDFDEALAAATRARSLQGS